MKKLIKEVDEKRGIVQVTTQDERWYLRPVADQVTGLPTYKGVPSVTWIADSYPKGIGFYKWLADKGWDEAEAIKNAAGDKGSKVHLAIADVLAGKEVRIDSKYTNPTTGVEEELTLEEADCILSFAKWFQTVKPQTITWEKTLFSDKHNYAGTLDYLCKIGEDYWIIDFKTSQYIWPSFGLQVSAYRQTIINAENDITFPDMIGAPSEIKTGILQLGYKRNKDGYKFTEIEDKFDLFLAAQKIWREDHGDETPSQKDYPIVLSPALPVETTETEVDPLPAKKTKKTQNEN